MEKPLPKVCKCICPVGKQLLKTSCHDKIFYPVQKISYCLLINRQIKIKNSDRDLVCVITQCQSCRLLQGMLGNWKIYAYIKHIPVAHNFVTLCLWKFSNVTYLREANVGFSDLYGLFLDINITICIFERTMKT